MHASKESTQPMKTVSILYKEVVGSAVGSEISNKRSIIGVIKMTTKAKFFVFINEMKALAKKKKNKVSNHMF